MAKFVLAGRADCPDYAKAELLSDLLHLILPDFHTRKLCIHPDDWENWLRDTCSSKGWKHESSPIVWRELTEGGGGKGLLLGGLSDFMEHAQGYYGVTLDHDREQMVKIAAENLEMAELLLQEKHQQNKPRPSFRIWISSALNPICYNLLPLLFTSGALCRFPTVSLHLLHLGGDTESLSGLKMEVEDLVLSQISEVALYSDLASAFQSADLIIFLDEDADEEQEEGMKSMVTRFRDYGRAIEANANEKVRVLVGGGAHVNLKCWLLIKNAPSKDQRCFLAGAMQLEGEARAQVAMKLSVQSSDVANVIVWGNIGGGFYIDLQRADVLKYTKGAIQGPAWFYQQILHIIHDKKWLQDDFPNLVASRRRDIALRSNRTAAISAANGIVKVLNAWINGSSPEEIFSVGVLSTGYFNVPIGLVFCMPLTFHGGEWSVCPYIAVDGHLQCQLEAAVTELLTEITAADEMMLEDPAVTEHPQAPPSTSE